MGKAFKGKELYTYTDTPPHLPLTIRLVLSHPSSSGRQQPKEQAASASLLGHFPDLVATPMAEQVRQCQHPASLVPRNPILREKGVGPRHRREVQPTPRAHANTTPGLVATFPAGSRGSGSKPRARPASAASEGEAGVEPVQ